MDLIESIRPMMAEEKFAEAQAALEASLVSIPIAQRPTAISLLLECYLRQKKSLPDQLVLEVLSEDREPSLVLEFFQNSSPALQTSGDSRVLLFRMKRAESRGQLQELHDLISEFQLGRFTRSLPVIPSLVSDYRRKYFRNDFQLRLQGLALELLRADGTGAEREVRDLILEAVEKSSVRSLRQKLTSIRQVIEAQTERGALELYLGFLQIFLDGFTEKRDYKRLAEFVIFIDDFRFETMILKLLVDAGEGDLAQTFLPALVKRRDYDFVYVAKHFPELKPWFVAVPETESDATPPEVSDLSLTEDAAPGIALSEVPLRSDDESILIQLVRTQSYDDPALLDLAVSFLQSELPAVAFEAANTLHRRALDPKLKLKAAYLMLTSLLLTGDYRRVIDLALESMADIRTNEDLLSFLYCEAEAYIRLGQKTEARQVLRRILSINGNYRLAQERLEKLG